MSRPGRVHHDGDPAAIASVADGLGPESLGVVAQLPVVGTDRARFPFPVKGGYLDLYNNNPFIRMGMQGITGVKTGYTDAAGRCYVTTRRIGDRHLGVVLLDSPNPLKQVPALLEAGAG